jgi:hypothetical protein
MPPPNVQPRSNSTHKTLDTTNTPPPHHQDTDTDTTDPPPPVPTAKRWRTSLASRLQPRFERIVKAFSMQRYTVTVVAPGTTNARPSPAGTIQT